MLSRREVFRGVGLALAGAGASALRERALPPARPPCRRLIAFVLAGGADGLNIVVPHAEQAYYFSRPSIAVPRSGDGRVIDLDGFFGLHPALAPLEPLYRTGTLAIVHACGLAGQRPSHLEAQDALCSAIDTIRLACPALPGSATTGPAVEVTAIRMPGWDHHANEGAADGALASRLKTLARRINRTIGEPGYSMSDTVLVVLSEFGRSAAENGRCGTEHGQGGTVLVIGDRVNGGLVHGPWPGLEPGQLASDGTSLRITTDVRDVLAEIAAAHLGLSVSPRPGHEIGPATYPGIMRRAMTRSG